MAGDERPRSEVKPGQEDAQHGVRQDLGHAQDEQQPEGAAARRHCVGNLGQRLDRYRQAKDRQDRQQPRLVVDGGQRGGGHQDPEIAKCSGRGAGQDSRSEEVLDRSRLGEQGATDAGVLQDGDDAEDDGRQRHQAEVRRHQQPGQDHRRGEADQLAGKPRQKHPLGVGDRPVADRLGRSVGLWIGDQLSTAPGAM